ncbi:MAG: bifunctional nuclease family protein [Treponema sp.]|jgi:bifunctional DNase/RNase|nr:bifunctional nuclease family protein [Treponema sp.]
MDKMLETEIWSIARIDQGSAVLLRPLGMDLVVPIFIGPPEMHAILVGLGNVKVKRPLSCDLFLEMTRQLGIRLFRVEVHEIREDIFYARIFLVGREFSLSNPLIIESRPSDAFAMAVREKCPVFMASRVLDRVGIPSDIFVDGMDDGGKAPPLFPDGEPEKMPLRHRFQGEKPLEEPRREQDKPLAVKRRRLQAELERAVETEAYERAAEIRDLLVLLDQQIEQERRGKEAP